MSRFHYSVLFILFVCLIGLNVLDTRYHESLPKIELPEAAHHIVGQMPIVEHYDDGNLNQKPGYPTNQIINCSVPIYQGGIVSSDMCYSGNIIQVNGVINGSRQWGYIQTGNMMASGSTIQLVNNASGNWNTRRRRQDDDQ